MVGKLNIGQGEDYAFDIRRARQVAEAGPPDPFPTPDPVDPPADPPTDPIPCDDEEKEAQPPKKKRRKKAAQNE